MELQMIADVTLALQVRDKLAATRRDLGWIAVVVDGGKVHLRGPVRSFYLRQVAVDRARSVAGAKQVLDEMRVEEDGFAELTEDAALP
jgi:osmotically-inducible protein OsmY